MLSKPQDLQESRELMGRISVAFRAFFAALFNAEAARRLSQALSGEEKSAAAPPPTTAPITKTEPTRKPEAPARSEALTLLAALQREARFLDFVQESLDGASDEQIGAVVRDVHRSCAAVLDRMFAIQPLLKQAEGDAVEVPAGFDSAKYRLTGNVAGQPPHQGRLEHHGWQATKCELPTWSGSSESTLVIAPAQVEL